MRVRCEPECRLRRARWINFVCSRVLVHELCAGVLLHVGYGSSAMPAGYVLDRLRCGHGDVLWSLRCGCRVVLRCSFDHVVRYPMSCGVLMCGGKRGTCAVHVQRRLLLLCWDVHCWNRIDRVLRLRVPSWLVLHPQHTAHRVSGWHIRHWWRVVCGSSRVPAVQRRVLRLHARRIRW